MIRTHFPSLMINQTLIPISVSSILHPFVVSGIQPGKLTFHSQTTPLIRGSPRAINKENKSTSSPLLWLHEYIHRLALARHG